jgi:signal peptidase I
MMWILGFALLGFGTGFGLGKRRRWPIAIAAALTAAGLGFWARPVRVASTSMLPTILPADRLWVDRLHRAPRRGDVIVFHHRGEEEGELVKRVIGLPGDRVAMHGSLPVVNGDELPSCDAGTFVWFGATRSSRGHLVVEWLDGRAHLAIHAAGPHAFADYVVQPGELFVLGDNRGVSNDSRSWAQPGVAFADVEGTVAHVLFGADRAGAIDLGRVGQKIGTALQVPGVDLAPLRERVEKCLAEGPASQAPHPIAKIP